MCIHAFVFQMTCPFIAVGVTVIDQKKKNSLLHKKRPIVDDDVDDIIVSKKHLSIQGKQTTWK